MWTESSGKPHDPAVLLLMGAGEPGIMWPTSFCEDLAHHSLFVIRFDYRDVGKLSPVDYTQSPYTVMDLAYDAIAILDSYSLQKAYFVGFSMGEKLLNL